MKTTKGVKKLKLSVRKLRREVMSKAKGEVEDLFEESESSLPLQYRQEGDGE